jgi:hypothetical protein
MIKYKFEQFNIEIVNPTIEILTEGISIFPNSMTIEVDIILQVDSAKFGLRLEDIKVENLTFDSGTLYTRVMTRLKDFEV